MNPTDAQYHQITLINHSTGGGGGFLPFTGLDIYILAAVALLMIATGVGLYVASTRRAPDSKYL